MPSEKAMQIANDVLDKATTVSLCNNLIYDADAAADIIDAALAEARIEGARAMKSASGSAARLAMVGNPNADELTCSICAAAVSALDPQQVINERK